MRFRVEIQESYQTHQDSCGQPFFDWRAVCSAWASVAEDGSGWLIKHTDKVKQPGRGVPVQRVVGNSRIMTIGKIEEIEDAGVKFLKLIFSSIRGDIARMRTAPKPAGLPDAQDQRGEDPQGMKIL